jgi:hypothetical protein
VYDTEGIPTFRETLQLLSSGLGVFGEHRKPLRRSDIVQWMRGGAVIG